MFSTDQRRSVAERRADATREAVLDAAWALSRAKGLTGWSLRELAKDIGLSAPTLYAYFDSKGAIYDAMFRTGYEDLGRLAAEWDVVVGERPTRSSFKAVMHRFFDFCVSDPTRYQLLFQRVIPDFTPSDEAYAASIATYERFRAQLARLGVTDQATLDLWTAITTGLTDQQISNDPGGDRWARLVDTAVDLFCDHVGIPDEGGNP